MQNKGSTYESEKQANKRKITQVAEKFISMDEMVLLSGYSRSTLWHKSEELKRHGAFRVGGYGRLRMSQENFIQWMQKESS